MERRPVKGDRTLVNGPLNCFVCSYIRITQSFIYNAKGFLYHTRKPCEVHTYILLYRSDIDLFYVYPLLIFPTSSSGTKARNSQFEHRAGSSSLRRIPWRKRAAPVITLALRPWLLSSVHQS